LQPCRRHGKKRRDDDGVATPTKTEKSASLYVTPPRRGDQRILQMEYPETQLQSSQVRHFSERHFLTTFPNNHFVILAVFNKMFYERLIKNF